MDSAMKRVTTRNAHTIMETAIEITINVAKAALITELAMAFATGIVIRLNASLIKETVTMKS